MGILIRIGTRKSPLALLQAYQVASKLQSEGYETEIIPIDSIGDIDLVQPIYNLGITGVFTKNLDIALLNNTIDIAVHSLKDIPTQVPEGLVLSSVLERDFPDDVMVWNESSNKDLNTAKIGTGSLRREAFLKYDYPDLQCENIRGNVQTRIKRMKERALDGVVFSLAGIARLGLDVEVEKLPGLIPAPGQGVVACVSRLGEYESVLATINHDDTFACITIEREFLATLEGGCTAPIGAFAYVDTEGIIHFVGGICERSGKEKMIIKKSCTIEEFQGKGKKWAEILIANGAKDLLPNRDEN